MSRPSHRGGASGPHAAGASAPRPLHLRPALIALVMLGGAFGTLARYGGESLVPRVADLPWPTFAVNLVGAFALGMLLEALARRGADAGLRRVVRLGLGTGFLGAFTTYSSLADDAVLLLHSDRILAAVLYGVVSVLAGLGAAAAGVGVAAWLHRRRERGAASGDPSPDGGAGGRR